MMGKRRCVHDRTEKQVCAKCNAGEDAEEAMRLALLYVFQAKQMTAFTAIAVIRALEQDGYVVIKKPPKRKRRPTYIDEEGNRRTDYSQEAR
jgi:hypothetical protein